LKNDVINSRIEGLFRLLLNSTARVLFVFSYHQSF
jgi:hypothetical protein